MRSLFNASIVQFPGIEQGFFNVQTRYDGTRIFSPNDLYMEYMDVSKNRGILPPKWMVYFMKNAIKMG